MSVFFMPRLRMNSLRAWGLIPLSFRDWSDHSRGSFQPMNVLDFTSLEPFDFDIFTPSILNIPL